MPFCTQCGHQVAPVDVFCASCGKQQTPPSASAPGAPRPPFAAVGPARDPLENLSPRTASILCYVPTVGWIAAVVVLATRKFKLDRIVRFHAFQGLYLFAAWLLVQWVIRPLMQAAPDRMVRVDHLLEAVLLGVSILMMVKASHNEAYVLPIIGELAQKSAAEQ